MKIGIRREDKNIWEGRVPLIPTDIKELMRQHTLEFSIQPSKIRAFNDEEYQAVGISVKEDLSDCDLIIAVKEIPVDFFQENKNYLFFSHTIKGQQENIPILKKIIEKKSTLIDYERIVDNENRRIVFFGKYAGIAGMIDSFYGFGQRLTRSSNPMTQFKYATDYKNMMEVEKLYKSIGDQIKAGKSDKPVIIGIAGYGNVSQGAQQIIDLLPVKKLSPQKLLSLDKSQLSTNYIYKVIFKEKDLVTPKSSDDIFELLDYYTNPDKYKSIFHQYLHQLDIIINATYWDQRYPRLITCDFLKNNAEKLKNLKIIGDISCDVNGGIECTKMTTNSGDPFFNYDNQTGKLEKGLDGNGPAILAVDNLPGEVSRDSSCFFSNILKKYIPKLCNANLNGSYDNLKIADELKRAIIIHKGQLTTDYKYLEYYF